jgi:hypothetical protein
MMTVPLNGDARAWDRLVARDARAVLSSLRLARILATSSVPKCLYRMATNGDKP